MLILNCIFLIKNYNTMEDIIKYENFIINESNNNNLKFNKKYYDVVFLNEFSIDKLYIGDNTYKKLILKKGDNVRIFIDTNKSTNEKVFIKGIKPMNTSEQVVSNQSNTLVIKNLWSANFIVENVVIKNNKLPFKIIQ